MSTSSYVDTATLVNSQELVGVVKRVRISRVENVPEKCVEKLGLGLGLVKLVCGSGKGLVLVKLVCGLGTWLVCGLGFRVRVGG